MPRNAAKKLSTNNNTNNRGERLPGFNNTASGTDSPICEKNNYDTTSSITSLTSTLTTTATATGTTTTISKATGSQSEQRIEHKSNLLFETTKHCESIANEGAYKEVWSSDRKLEIDPFISIERIQIKEINCTEANPSSLYPIVVEAVDQCAPQGTAALASSIDATKAILSASETATVTKAQTALTKRSRGGKSAVLNVKVVATREPHSRLLTLRARKTLTLTPANTPTPTPINSSGGGGGTLVKVTQISAQQQQLPQQKLNFKDPKPTATTPDLRHLDIELLNRIETLDWEVKKSGGNKRKNSNSIITISLRRRSSTRKNSNSSSTSSSTISNISRIESGVTSSIAATTSTVPNLATSAVTDGCDIGSASKKRPRIMSLYERRYQNDEGGRGVVSNGYLSSTRNVTATGGASIMHTEADAQDISNQYYMSSSTLPSGGGTGGGGGSGNGGGTALGNGSVINHAPSMATLCNIGNTCYLNSVVYTLRFAPQFLHNLHHLIVDLNAVQQNILRHRAKSSSLGRGVSAVHMENARSWSNKDLASLEQYNNAGGSTSSVCNITQKSSHQLLTEKLHELYQSLHRNEVSESTEPFHADTLLHAIQDVSTIFEGNQQQDAHEFLMCLLNSIRETCQTLIKAIAECPDIIINGYISSVDDVDNNTYAMERETVLSGSNSGTSSLSTSNITKGSFFSRKSKRKEEAKNSKNLRLQSPLKDGSNSNALQQQQQHIQSQQHQATSNSLFYLNTVDLSGGSSNSNSNSNNSNSNTTQAIKAPIDEEGASVNILKDKERLAEKIRELGLDFFSEDFEGVTVSTTKCLSCETVTEQKESMIDIAVPVPISGYDNSEYTEKPSTFIQNSCITREYFRAENKYRCEQCTGYTEAIRSISYEVLPRLLVIQLSRFSGGMEKINSYIPTSFTLQCFCSKCCELSDANKLHIYKLYSVITHVGATMSVGHYIAYTCSLDWANEYMNCPKDRRSSQQQQQQQQQQPQQQTGNNGYGGVQSNGYAERSSQTSAASAAASALASSGTSLMKKMKFGRNKASSSGDMSKHLKTLNGITSKTITNGIGKLSMNTTCHGMNCCATRLCTVQQQLQHQQLNASTNNSDLSEESMQNGSNHSVQISTTSGSSYSNFPSSGYGSTGRGGTKHHPYGSYQNSATSSAAASSSSSSFGSGNGNGNGNAEPIWYMCDDDKIKAMTQREFEDLLSPTRKITITPYLLFYARFDLQQPSQPTPPKQTPPPQPSWSNESLRESANSSATGSGIATKI